MNKEFVPKKESKELQQLGFDEDCLAFYNGNFLESTEYDFDSCNSKEVGLCTKAPTFSQAFRFFREKHDLVHRIDRDGGWWICAILNLYDEKDQGAIEIYLENSCQNLYEEAELVCLRKLIELVK